jgi:hypothetical protein
MYSTTVIAAFLLSSSACQSRHKTLMQDKNLDVRSNRRLCMLGRCRRAEAGLPLYPGALPSARTMTMLTL